MTIKCELTMLTFTKTKNTRLPDCVHNAGVTLQSRDIPHTLPSPIFYERALMPASHFDVKPMTGRPKFIVRHSQGGLYFNRPGHWLCCQIS
jgi:hypothetical protein